MHRFPLKSITLAALAFAMLLPQTAGASSCLRWDDINTLKRETPDTVIARTHDGDYTIKFKQACAYLRTPANYFVVRPHDHRSCVKTLGALPVHEAGACFIDSIEPVASNE